MIQIHLSESSRKIGSSNILIGQYLRIYSMQFRDQLELRDKYLVMVNLNSNPQQHIFYHLLQHKFKRDFDNMNRGKYFLNHLEVNNLNMKRQNLVVAHFWRMVHLFKQMNQLIIYSDLLGETELKFLESWNLLQQIDVG